MSDMDEQGCTCHVNPPCSFCMSLTEEEAEIFHKGGAIAVYMHRAHDTSKDENEEE